MPHAVVPLVLRKRIALFLTYTVPESYMRSRLAVSGLAWSQRVSGVSGGSPKNCGVLSNWCPNAMVQGPK